MDKLAAGWAGHGLRRGAPRLTLVMLPLLGVLSTGCATSAGIGTVVEKAMASTGLRAPRADAPQEHVVPMRLYSAENLNSGAGTRSLALVVRVYQLRSLQRFEQAPLDAFLDEAAERAALGEELVSATEVLLTPGQRHEFEERVAAGANHLGVVALFRAPAGNRWRFAFDSRKAVRDGITIGLHACAMTTTSTALLTSLASEPHSLSSVNCAAKRR